MNDSTFGARLALVRMRMGWNMKEAARECGLNAQTWRLWEVDGATPRNQVRVTKQISSATGCDYLWLLLGPDRGDGGTESNILARMPLTPRIVTVAGQPHPGHSRPVRRTRPARSTHHAVTAAAA